MKLRPDILAYTWFTSLQSHPKKIWPKISAVFLRLLEKEGKLTWLPRILEAIQDLEDQEEGVTRARMYTARDKKDLSKMATVLLQTERVAIEQEVVPALMGGVIVETKNHRWDLSLAGRLNQLKQRLTE